MIQQLTTHSLPIDRDTESALDHVQLNRRIAKRNYTEQYYVNLAFASYGTADRFDILKQVSGA